jgi:hypothetical protein
MEKDNEVLIFSALLAGMFLTMKSKDKYTTGPWEVEKG